MMTTCTRNRWPYLQGRSSDNSRGCHDPSSQEKEREKRERERERDRERQRERERETDGKEWTGERVKWGSPGL